MIDEKLDAALREYSNREPRPGMERRVLSRVQASPARRSWWWTGWVLTAAALLAKTPNPTDDQITQAMNGNICRCGTYERIRKAVHRAAGNGGAR